MNFSQHYFLLLLNTNRYTTINAATASTASNQGTADEGVGVGAVTATATPTAAVATPASKTPGFEVIFAVVSLAVAYLVVFRKKGKRSE